MSQNVNPLHDLPDDEKKKVILTNEAKIEGDVKNLLVNPKFESDVHIGDTYVQAEARLRETQGLHGVPELPTAFIPRTEDLAPIKSVFITGEAASLGITGKAMKVGMQGMGGIGKSTLAAALARDPDIQKRFPQGIFWLSFGQQPNLLNLQAQLADLLETNQHTFTDVANGKTQLERMLKGRCCLLILDDIWRADHAEAFSCVDAGAQACLLVTTRNQDVLIRLDARQHALDIFTPEQALGMLAEWTGIGLPSLPPEAQELAKECGYLPLALAMAGAMAKQKGWGRALERLRRTDFDRIEKAFPYAYPNLLRALQASLDDLQENDTPLAQLQARDRYVELAIFPEDTPIPTDVLKTMWCAGADGLDDLDFDDLLDGLIGCALLQRNAENSVTLHDLQRDFIVLTAKGERALPERQAAFLDLYRTKTTDGDWHTLPDDGYIYQRLVWHMAEAEQAEILRGLLLDFYWLRARLDKTDVNGLILDFYIALNRNLGWDQDTSYTLRMVRDALRISAHVLTQDKFQLSSQLLGRMLGFEQPEIQVLMKQIKNWKSDRPWLRPIAPCLQPPGGPLIRTLAGHTARVNDLAVTGDGRRVISASDDYTLKIWDVESGEEVRTLAGHTAGVTALALTGDGKRVISASDDCTLKIWDMESGDELHTLFGHFAGITAFVLSEDSKLVISASWDEVIYVWDIESGEVLGALIGHTKAVTALALTWDGKQVISASDDFTLKIWDVDSGTELHTLTGHTHRVVALEFARDGKQVISASWDNTLKVWDVESGEEVRTLAGHTAHVAAFVLTGDGKRVISASWDNTLKIWDLESGEVLHTLVGHTANVTALALTGDDKQVISASHDKTLIVWDVESGEVLHTLVGHTVFVDALALTGDDRRVISASWDKTLKIWDVENRKELRILAEHTRVKDLVLTRDGKRAISVPAYDNNIKVWDVESGEEVRTLAGHTAGVTALVLTGDNKRVISASYDHTIKVWDVESGEVLHTLVGHIAHVTALALTEDDKQVVSAGDITLKIWDVESGVELHTLDGFDFGVTALVLTGDGKRLISVSEIDYTIKVRDMESGEEVRTLAGHTAGVTALVLTGDNKRVISASYDHTIRVWDTESGMELHTLAGHNAGVIDLVLTGDGKRVISASDYSNTLKVWDVESGMELHTLAGHTAGVNDFKLTGDSMRVISASADKTLKVWDLSDGHCLITITLEGSVSSSAISSDGQKIIASDEVGNMYFLKLDG